MDLYHGDSGPPFSEGPESEFDGDGVLVRTATRVPVELRPVEHELTPEGCTCFGSFLNGHLIARCVLDDETAERFLELDLLQEPVHLALYAREEDPGLQGRLLALTPLPADGGMADASPGADEPWKQSVPSSNYEQAVAGDEAGPGPGAEDGEDGPVAAIFLGQIVRFEKDRKHPDDLTMEAADVLRSVVKGSVNEVVDRVLQQLTEPVGGEEDESVSRDDDTLPPLPGDPGFSDGES